MIDSGRMLFVCHDVSAHNAGKCGILLLVLPYIKLTNFAIVKLIHTKTAKL